jgi:hypothetical protein
MATLATILNAPLPQGGAIQTLYTASRSTEIADSMSIVNTYGINIWVYLAITPPSMFAPRGALVYGQMLGPNERMTFDQRYMQAGYKIEGYANVGNAVQLACNILR